MLFCNNSGYLGRTGVYEIMKIDKEHKDYIMKNINSEALRELSIKKGMKTLKTYCRDLVLKGITTVEELVKITFLKE